MDSYPPKSYPETLVPALQDWALGNGLTMLLPGAPSTAVHAPTTLFPSPFPRKAFFDALVVQQYYNELYARVALDEAWLTEIISDLAKFDKDFTGKLWETFLLAKKKGITQPLSLGLFRSDYLVHQDDDNDSGAPGIKQVEFNTVSVSFGALTSKVAELHNYLIASGAYGDSINQKFYQDTDLVPVSTSIDLLADGLASGHNAYIKGRSDTELETKPSILFVVQPNELNALDQRHIEYSLLKNHGIRSFRVTLADVSHTTRSDPLNNRLIHIASNTEVSVVYYRSGYAPTDYPSQKEWDARLYLETTTAIKCPTLLTQLAGAKKIQQILTDKAVLKQFLPNACDDNIESIIKTHVAIYPLDESAQGLESRKLAFEQPERFVLKPQREGGGNNVYKSNIPSFLNSIPEEEWAGYILMELINPPIIENKIIRKGEIYDGEIVSELGIFGTMLWNSSTGEIIENDTAGWLLRSKLQSSDEGGVAAGFGCVDGVYLV
ncbi:glutathione synthetase [Nadsonia fulvescens var. elongata DSM 6958]|uniref:Glutathione synthetase n=1 Tax=Nadsonia fulvescens var. elongata DSM 6958 TaxID=857566 RepID=A0A1E3PEV2_9ASCO|nr:glutathione synthetase [Nadsonia fulvescens var. elongata DSM 6958]